MLMKKLLLFSLAMLGIASACKKEETQEVKKSKQAYLTTGTWRLVGFTISPGIVIGGTTVTDFYSNLPACEKDDFQQFFANGTALTDEGPTKCDASNPQQDPFTWAFNSSESEIIFDTTEPYQIVALNATQFNLKRVVDGSTIFGGISGQSYIVSLSMVH
jgi:hypothetical protein